MKRTQIGWVFLAVIIAILAFVAYQKQDTSTIIVLVAFSTILLLLFYKLTIKVSEEYVKISLGIGLISGKYKLERISHCKSLSYIPFGWGIRLRPGVILFNVSGTKAIELEIKNKREKYGSGPIVLKKLRIILTQKNKYRSIIR